MNGVDTIVVRDPVTRNTTKFKRWLADQVARTGATSVKLARYQVLGGSPLLRLDKLVALLESGIQTIAVDHPAGPLARLDILWFHRAERALRSERLRASIAVARAAGVRLGRPTKITTEVARTIRRLHREGLSQGVIARQTSISRAAVWRVLREAADGSP